MGASLARGVKLVERRPGGAVGFYKDNMDADYENALRIIAETKGWHAFMPP